MAESGEGGAENEGDEQEETDAEDEAEGEEALFQDGEITGFGGGGHVPNQVESGAKFDEDAGGSEEERGEAENGCGGACGRVAGLFKHGADDRRALGTDGVV